MIKSNLEEDVIAYLGRQGKVSVEQLIQQFVEPGHSAVQLFDTLEALHSQGKVTTEDCPDFVWVSLPN